MLKWVKHIYHNCRSTGLSNFTGIRRVKDSELWMSLLLAKYHVCEYVLPCVLSPHSERLDLFGGRVCKSMAATSSAPALSP